MPLRTPTHHPSPGFQGYFDPTAISQNQQHIAAVSNISSSQAAAAQAAMQSASRKRATTIPPSASSPPSQGTTVIATANSAAGAAAANAAMPRPGLESSPSAPTREAASPPSATINTSPPATKDKSSSKMGKLWSKAPSRVTGSSASSEKGTKPPPSPSKISHPIPQSSIQSISRLNATLACSDRKGSIFNSSSSTVALVKESAGTAIDFIGYPPQPPFASPTVSYSSSPPLKSEGHSHRPHFLRPRKDNTVALSSASSNSKPISADGSSIYSFGPSSPSSSVFVQSHQKALGDTKYGSISKDDNLDPSADDWGKVKRLVQGLFEREPLRTPVEDMNKLVSNHIRYSYERRNPIMLLEDVREILRNGMSIFDLNQWSYPDDKIVAKLVDIWQFVFSQVLPYFEAVFLPLQQEFKGVGQIMNSREAREFWGDVLIKDDGSSNEMLDVRRMALISFRDHVILPSHTTLSTLFSKLQLDLSSDLPNATESVARVLQCISVLASILSGDDAQAKVDELAKKLKHNWLSRGRVGRNRMGFVGTKARPVAMV